MSPIEVRLLEIFRRENALAVVLTEAYASHTAIPEPALLVLSVETSALRALYGNDTVALAITKVVGDIAEAQAEAIEQEETHVRRRH